MMNIDKRGASHADWAISLGIFLLYVLSMLMLIQPGAQPFYKEDELLNIVTGNYKASTSFMFYKTPLVIDTTGMQFTPGAPDYIITFNAAFPFSGDVNNYAITDSAGAIIGEYAISSSWDRVQISPASFAEGITTFYIISNRLADGTTKQYNAPNAPAGLEISNTALPTPNFTLIIGSTETLQGVSADLLEKNIDLQGIYCRDAVEDEQDRKYNVLKRRWGFPRSKEFIVFYTDTASAQYDSRIAPDGDVFPVCMVADPYEQASVVVEEWAARIVDELGNTVPIRMVARVW